MEYLARIKVHNPTSEGVLVELNGEFDVSCLEAFERALDRASAMATAVFVDLSGVGFMDALCTRKLLRRARGGPGKFGLCGPSQEVELSAAACGLRHELKTCPPDDPAYEAVIRETCRLRPPGDDASRRSEHDLYLRHPSGAAP